MITDSYFSSNCENKETSKFMSLFGLILLYDALRPSQHFFSHDGTFSCLHQCVEPCSGKQRFWLSSHKRAAKAQTSLRQCTDSSETSLLAYT